VIVRSDDIDGNDIIGTVTDAKGTTWRFRAHATDGGEMIGSELDPV
jgi:hypothetical protein